MYFKIKNILNPCVSISFHQFYCNYQYYAYSQQGDILNFDCDKLPRHWFKCIMKDKMFSVEHIYKSTI
jgi:hypothetical protein